MYRYLILLKCLKVIYIINAVYDSCADSLTEKKLKYCRLHIQNIQYYYNFITTLQMYMYMKIYMYVNIFF